MRSVDEDLSVFGNEFSVENLKFICRNPYVFCQALKVFPFTMVENIGIETN